jgi:hypothetical protein
MDTRTNSDDISVTSWAVPEKLVQYYDPAALIEFTLFCKLFNFVVQENHRTFSEAMAISKDCPDLENSQLSVKFSQQLGCPKTCSDSHSGSTQAGSPSENSVPQ